MVLPFFKQLIDNIAIIKPKLSQRELIIKNILDSSPKNTNISLKKIESQFEGIAKSKKIKTIKKSTIHYIIRNILKYRYRKLTIKTNKLLDNNYIKFCFFS